MVTSTVKILLHTLPEYEHALQCALLDAGIDISYPVKEIDFLDQLDQQERRLTSLNQLIILIPLNFSMIVQTHYHINQSIYGTLRVKDN